VARLNLPNMAYAPDERVEVYAAAVRGLIALEPDPEKQLKYLDFVDIYAKLDDTERARYEREFSDEAETMKSFSERFREEGIQQGMRLGEQQGVKQGVRMGEATALLRVMRRKFGELPEPARQRIESADPDTLLEWLDRTVTAASIDEVIH
jgi:flagellar biosynthesis/type III secretory pathway protein FliH